MDDFHPPAVRGPDAGQLVSTPAGSVSIAEALFTIPAVERTVRSIASAIADFIDMVTRAWERAERAHRRQALKEAYRLRH